jgi:cytochrome c-type biogenesis protein CcmH/NrfG
MTELDTSSRKIWRSSHAYGMAALCFLIGLPMGYFMRGSARPAVVPATMSTPMTAPAPQAQAAVEPAAPNAPQQKMPTLDDMKRMADKQVEPLMAKLQKNPKDAQLLNQVAMNFKAAHQFKEAAVYFKKSLDVDPKNVAVRDDYASCLYYSGDVDGALAELQKSLKYEPTHPGTLFNLGMIRWKGKGDVDGAVAAWKELLKTNPNLPQKENVEQLISKAQQHPDVANAQPQN